MKAMLLDRITLLADNPEPLRLADIPEPEPGADEVRLKITACGVCHTELDEIEGRTPPPVFPMILGHQIVGYIDKIGSRVTSPALDQRVGIGWIHSSCLQCDHCREGNHNLCSQYKAAGRDAFGGYAEYCTVPAAFTFPIPASFTDVEAAPLLCAGAIGYRSVRLTGMKNGQKLGLTGFGASGHLVLKLVKCRYPESDIYVFARSKREQQFALELGAAWAGDIGETSPEKCRAIIDTTPVWKPVVEALKNLEAGGRLVINAIRKEDGDKQYLLNLDYPTHLWLEKEIKSVANVAPRDIAEFLQIASEISIKPEVITYPLEDANLALFELKKGGNRGAKVLIM